MKSILATGALVVLATVTPAQFAPVSQIRTVESQAVTNSESFAASDFLPFNAIAQSFYSASSHACCAHGTAQQDSELQSSRIATAMFAYGHVNAGPSPGRGRSYFEYQFALGSAFNCELRGSLLGRGFQTSGVIEMTVSLSGPDGEVYSVVSDIPTFTSIPILYEAMLAPGEYTLIVEVFANGPSGLIASEAYANLSLSTCGGDFDDNGAIDVDDLSRLLSNFGDSNVLYENGDMNGDDVIDLSDLTELLSRFGENCV